MSAQAIDVHHESSMQVQRGDAPMISMIERIAMDPNIPLDRLEKMLDMKERMEDRAREQMREDREYESKNAYFSAMSACQKELPVVLRNRRNTHTNSSYADLADIEKQAMPTIYKHGFGVSFQPDGYNDLGELLIKWEISHSGGYVRNGVGAIPVDGAGAKGGVNKTGTQAFGSTATYGRRYLLCMLFNISTGDDRDGNNPPKQEIERISEDQQMKIREMLEATESNEAQFLALGGINELSDMAANQFDNAMNILKQRLAQRGR